MGIITKMLKEKAVYWAPTGTDSDGQPTWGAPVELNVRWEDVSMEFLDEDGVTCISRARVYVSADVETRGVLFRGALTSTLDEDDPKANDNAWEIRRYEKLPNFKATEFLRTTFL